MEYAIHTIEKDYCGVLIGADTRYFSRREDAQSAMREYYTEAKRRLDFTGARISNTGFIMEIEERDVNGIRTKRVCNTNPTACND